VCLCVLMQWSCDDKQRPCSPGRDAAAAFLITCASSVSSSASGEDWVRALLAALVAASNLMAWWLHGAITSYRHGGACVLGCGHLIAKHVYRVHVTVDSNVDGG
jgi:hypothetical protein